MNLFYHFNNIGLSKIIHIIDRQSRFIALRHIIKFDKPIYSLIKLVYHKLIK